MKRVFLTAALALMLFVASVGVAGATKPPADGADPADGHKITICHATSSLSNPDVEITIDVAAWNDPRDPKHHGDHHTSTKDGVTWSDYVLEEGGECAIDEPPPPPPPPTSCDLDSDIVIDFSGDKLIASDGHRTQTISGLSIPAGLYAVVLGSSDDPHDLPQQNEQWRALFGGSTYSNYAPDLPDGWPAGVLQETYVGDVFLGSAVDTIVAEHWSVAQTSLSADSVIPECIGLTMVSSS